MIHTKSLTSCIAFMLLIPLFTGCQSTRSISNSGYIDTNYRYNNASSPIELSEFDILGIDPKQTITEEDITQAISQERQVQLPKGSSIMLIQSGAQFPDESMRQALDTHFEVVTFSGLSNTKPSGNSYSKTLRLAAAQGGLEHIICYWGMLETADIRLATKTVSWVPLVGRVIPDEHQTMRIQLKMAIINVRTGQWAIITPSAQEDESISMKLTRENSDQKQVAKLKESGYQSLINQLVKDYISQ